MTTSMIDHPNLLIIETATHVCSVGILKRDGTMELKESQDDTYTHAEKLHVFVAHALHMAEVKYSQLDAVVVSLGPGSYTGLRIGVSAAKGYAFAHDKPLIGIRTLDALASAAVKEHPGKTVIPMIDARRMEVYAGFYSPEMKKLSEEAPVIIDEEVLKGWSDQYGDIVLCGDGAPKLVDLEMPQNIVIDQSIQCSAKHLKDLALERHQTRQFDDLAYTEPFYLKAYQAKKPGKMV